MGKKLAALILTAFALPMLSGCVSSSVGQVIDSSPSEQLLFDTPREGYAFAVTEGYVLMAQVLEDEVVTREEYQTAFDANLACRERNGWRFGTEQIWNPMDRLRLIVRETAPQGSQSDDYFAAEALCARQFEYISYLFQTTEVPITEPPLLARVEACLTENGIEFTPGGRSVTQILGPEIANSPDFDQALGCINEGLKTLYPDLAGYSIAL